MTVGVSPAPVRVWLKNSLGRRLGAIAGREAVSTVERADVSVSGVGRGSRRSNRTFCCLLEDVDRDIALRSLPMNSKFSSSQRCFPIADRTSLSLLCVVTRWKRWSSMTSSAGNLESNTGTKDRLESMDSPAISSCLKIFSHSSKVFWSSSIV